MYANHRSHILQQTIRQAAGDMRLLNPVTYAENHPNCRKNRDGHAVLPNGVMWQQNLLLYVFSSKILADTENVLKIQSTTSQMAQMGGQKIPPLPYLLSNMIQSKTPRKAPDDERSYPPTSPSLLLCCPGCLLIGVALSTLAIDARLRHARCSLRPGPRPASADRCTT